MHLRNILLVIGVFALVAGASLALLWLTQRPAIVATSSPSATAGGPSSVAPNGAKAILVAAHPIPSGTFLRSEDVVWKDSATDPEPAEIAQDPGADGKYLGAVTAKEFAAGEPLLTSALVKPGDRGFLTTLLTPGTRAISVAVDAVQSESGLLLPGNRVDIILTQTFDNDDPARKSVGETILKNVRVIAVDQRLGPTPAGANKTASPEVSMPKTITFEVNEREAQALMIASRLGRLEISLRSLGRADHSEPGDEDVGPLWASDVSPALRAMKRVVAVAAAAPRPSATTPTPTPAPARKPIEVMHGSKIEIR